MTRIVVVEDNPAILRGLADNLRAESYEVLTACDGEAGYRLMHDTQPDLVILDLNLPRMNGYEVCRRLRREGFATPVLMLTAENGEANRVEGFDAGVDDYVVKPFAVLELLGRVRAILKRSRGRVDLATQRELEDARQIQRRLMPDEIPQLAGCRIAAIWRPARIAGGDYFDVVKTSQGGIAISIADVCGKGMPAALMMANLQAAVRTCVARDLPPNELCATLNRLMCGNMEQGFISFFHATIEPGARQMTYCNSGHNPPMVGRKESTGAVERLSRGGMVLGVMPDFDYEQEVVPLRSGDWILLYTDGITEARNPSGEEFGEPRLISVISSATRDSSAIAAAAVEAAGSFGGGAFDDDVTVVAITVD